MKLYNDDETKKRLQETKMTITPHDTETLKKQNDKDIDRILKQIAEIKATLQSIETDILLTLKNNDIL